MYVVKDGKTDRHGIVRRYRYNDNIDTQVVVVQCVGVEIGMRISLGCSSDVVVFAFFSGGGGAGISEFLLAEEGGHDELPSALAIFVLLQQGLLG